MGLIEIVLASLCFNATCENYEDDINSMTTWKQRHLAKLGVELGQDTLRIATFKNGQLNGYETSEDGITTGTGVAFEIIHILQEKYHFNYNIVVPSSEVFLEPKLKNGAKKLLENEKADLAAALLPVVNVFRNTITYSRNIDATEWLVLMNRPKESATGSGLLAPFTTPVWILIIFSILIVGPIIYLLVLIQARLCKDDNNKVYPLPTCVWFVYGALLKQGSTLSPKTDSSRLLFSTWWIFIVILTAFYTANLTAFLTLSTFTLPITSVEDIGQKRYHWVTNRANGMREIIYAENRQILIGKKLVDKIGNYHLYPDKDDMEIVYEFVMNEDMMYIREKSVINHIMYTDYKEKARNGIEESKRCTFVMTKFPVLTEHRAFAYSKNFKYKDLFDIEIQHLVESGIILYKMRENLPDAEICPLNLKSTERKLRNSDLLLTYIIVGSGLAVATSIFLLEVLWRLWMKRYKKSRRARKTNLLVENFSEKNHSPRKNKNTFQFSLLGPPPAYQTLFNPPFSYKHTDGVKKNINGRDYWVIDKRDGFSQLIPLRTPSALLFQYSN